jgi:hypothetical protein
VERTLSKRDWSYRDAAAINGLHFTPYKLNGSMHDMHVIRACHAMTATPSACIHRRTPILLLIQR